MTPAVDFWPGCGFQALARDARGWLVPSDEYLQRLLARPELAPTGFNLHFPEDDLVPPETTTESSDPLAERSARRGAATFGKRGA